LRTGEVCPSAIMSGAGGALCFASENLLRKNSNTRELNEGHRVRGTGDDGSRDPLRGTRTQEYEEKGAQSEQALLQKLARKYNLVLQPKVA